MQTRGSLRFKMLKLANDLVSMNGDKHGPGEAQREWLPQLAEQVQSQICKTAGLQNRSSMFSAEADHVVSRMEVGKLWLHFCNQVHGKGRVHKTGFVLGSIYLI